MFIRFIISLALVLAPTVALADTANQSSAADSGALTPQVSGALLGPVSTSDSSNLQGASTNPLQSSTSNNYGLAAPVGDPLQASATSDDLKVLISSESDGSPVNVADTSASTDIPGLLLAGGIVLGMIGLVLFSRRRERRV